MAISPRVVHIGTADNSGGAARASYRIHQGLLGLGIRSTMLCGYTVEHNSPEIACIPQQRTILQKAFRLAINTAEQLSGLEYELLPWRQQFLRHPFMKEATVVHLHNLHGGFFPLSLLRELSTSKVLIWSIHDMWPMTGHCYYPDMFSCTRWQNGCHDCPGLQQDDHYPLSIDTTAHLWRRKRKLYSSLPLTVVAQSQWTLDQLRSSALLAAKPAHLIPYGLDTASFRPIDKNIARELLRLPSDSKVLFFSAVGPTSPRKGWTYLREALTIVRATCKERLVILVAGAINTSHDLGTDIPVVSLGTVTDDRMMMLAYNSADLFIGASLYETFGLVFLEAAACAVPSVAFNTSGVRDVIRHGKTGYLAQFLSSSDLAQGIIRLLTDDAERLQMALECRKTAVEEYSIELQASRFLELYQNRLQTHFGA